MSKIKVDIKNEHPSYKEDAQKIEEAIKIALRCEGVKEAQVSILLTDDKNIQKLNKQYRNNNTPTDVLAFLQYNEKIDRKKSYLLGDIVISVDAAKRQAKDYGQSFKKEFYLYLIHGVLHLLGYNDEDERSRKKMEKKQKDILSYI